MSVNIYGIVSGSPLIFIALLMHVLEVNSFIDEHLRAKSITINFNVLDFRFLFEVGPRLNPPLLLYDKLGL